MKKLAVALLALLGAGAAVAGPAGKFGDPVDSLNKYVFVENADAVAHEVGDLVVWSDASLMKVSTTTSANSKLVAGVVAFNDLPANGKGFIQVYGYNSAITVAVATAIGDGIASSTTAEAAGTGSTAGAIFGAFTEATTSSTTAKGFIRCGGGW